MAELSSAFKPVEVKETQMKPNLHLKAAIMEVVENQLRNLDPPETKQTYDRLLAEGHDDQEARRLIGCVVVQESFSILKRKEPFDAERYAEALSRLPAMTDE
jgi:hypothetical protein